MLYNHAQHIKGHNLQAWLAPSKQEPIYLFIFSSTLVTYNLNALVTANLSCMSSCTYMSLAISDFHLP